MLLMQLQIINTIDSRATSGLSQSGTHGLLKVQDDLSTEIRTKAQTLFARRVSLYERTRRLQKRLSFLQFNNTDSHNMTRLNPSALLGPVANTTVGKAATAAGLGVVFGQSASTSSATGLKNDQEPTSSLTLQDGPSLVNANYGRLLRYVRFSATAYVSDCAYPNGAGAVQRFGTLRSIQSSGMSSSALGFIAVDVSRNELIVVSIPSIDIT